MRLGGTFFRESSPYDPFKELAEKNGGLRADAIALKGDF